jgi:hypothetical protein
MPNAGFELRPVPRYEPPRYPTTCRDDEAAPPAAWGWREVIRVALALVLVLGLALGALACGDRARLAVTPPGRDGGIGDGGPPGDGGPDGAPPWDGATDDGGDILLGDIAECTPGDLYCADADTLMTCADSTYQAESCTERCVDEWGPTAFSQGCAAAAADPCQCEYDLLDGGMAACTPGEVTCRDEATAEVCDPATGSPTAVVCADYCTATYGAGATSSGCDASAADFCGCAEP